MKTQSTHSQAAKMIRQELKKAFPNTKFTVTSSGTGGTSINIGWDNGPSKLDILAIGNKYKCGHFNGMEDIYEYSNKNINLPQVEYIFVMKSE